jgi:hypothetical protein
MTRNACLFYGLLAALAVIVAVVFIGLARQRRTRLKRAGRLRELRVVTIALVFLTGVGADAQVVRLRGGGGGGAFSGGDVSGQTNICGPDNATNVEIGSCTNDANAGTGGTSTVIGNGASNASNAADNTIIGSGANVNTATATRNTVVGTNASASGAIIRSVVVGSQASVQGSQSVVVGDAAIAQGVNSVAVGYLSNAGTAGTSVAIGSGAVNTINGSGTVIIGQGAAITTSSGVDSMAIGRAATVTSANGIAIGAAATAGNQAVRVGNGGAAAAGSIALGISSVSAANEFVAGAVGGEISNVYFGKGKVNTTATAVTINGTGGSGADNAGADLQLDGGASTGTGRGGNVILRATPSSTTSSTPNTEENRHYIVAQRFALTDNTIATFSLHALGDDTGGGGTISYCVYARDATTAGSECGEIDYNGVDVTAGAGGEVCPNPTKQGTPLQALSGSTLTVTFTATTGTDLCNLRVTADTNIATPTALYLVWNASNPGGRTLTPQP